MKIKFLVMVAAKFLARHFSTGRIRRSLEYKKILENYFADTKFNLKPENHEKHIASLRRAMEIVYLRETPLVAFDVEAYERSPSKVTELGIAVYDPLQQETSVLPAIEQGHIIIQEHQKLMNSRYCPNNKQTFMGGTSYMMKMDDAKTVITGLLDEYITKRNGAFVGHHIEGDIKWFRSLGIQVPTLAEIVDTSKLYSYSRRRGATLRGILRLAGIPHGYLHNAGNDAYYTMLAVMAYCDPNVRRLKHLDTFEENEKLSASALRLQKFSDRAAVINLSDITKPLDKLFLP